MLSDPAGAIQRGFTFDVKPLTLGINSTKL